MSTREEYRLRPPEYTAPDDQRCEALVPGHPSWHREYTRRDHRCHKAACQMRGAIAVYHVHARARRVVPWRCE